MRMAAVLLGKRLMTRAFTVLPPAVIAKPLAPTPALVPFSSINGEPENPGCVVPSIITGSVIKGSADSGVIVCTPAPGMLKMIVFKPAQLFTSSIACRSDPAPLSAVVVTTPATVSVAEFEVAVVPNVSVTTTS